MVEAWVAPVVLVAAFLLFVLIGYILLNTRRGDKIVNKGAKAYVYLVDDKKKGR